MYYAPHILFKKVKRAPEIGPNGHPVFKDSEGWEEICRCRCDDNNGTKVQQPDGSFYLPNFHIVCDGRDIAVKAGDYVKAEWPDGTLRGEGEIKPMPKRTNHYDYTEIYV